MGVFKLLGQVTASDGGMAAIGAAIVTGILVPLAAWIRSREIQKFRMRSKERKDVIAELYELLDHYKREHEEARALSSLEREAWNAEKSGYEKLIRELRGVK